MFEKEENELCGYYLLDGQPCQIKESSKGDLEALIYIAGHGMEPIAVSEIIFKAEPVSEETFRSEMVELALNTRRSLL